MSNVPFPWFSSIPPFDYYTLLDGDLIGGIIPDIDFHDQIGIRFTV